MVPSVSKAPDGPVSIERATWRDLNPLRRIEKACFPKDAWPLLDLIGVLTLPNVIRLKAMADGEMAGFIAGDVRRSEDLSWISTVCVSPEYRGQGIGARLLVAFEEQAGVSQIRLSVRASNWEAIRLYERLGYRRYGIWPKYYSDGEDALVFEKTRG
jgi:ribosomal-protein-alanine N-acetyltransferase